MCNKLLGLSPPQRFKRSLYKSAMRRVRRRKVECIDQKELDNALEGLPGVTGIADDNFVYGSTEKEHDENLLRLMERAREKGIKFNADKLQLKCDEASFFGHTWTPEGVKPDNKKVSAILAMKPPDNAKDLQSFLGLVNYLFLFIKLNEV